MLAIALAVIIGGSIYLIVKAPSELRTTAVVLMLLFAGAGYGAGFLFVTDNDATGTYYPIAGAIGGWIVGAAIYDRLRKKHDSAVRKTRITPRGTRPKRA